MAQSIETAKYDTILRSAIATGLVDHIVPVEEMPAKLIAYAAHLSSLNGKVDGMNTQIGEQMGQVFNLLRRRSGHDFNVYKPSTIGRRLQRRMKALQMETVGEYIEVLERDPAEIERLFKEFLIGVTEFFRDPEAFERSRRALVRSPQPMRPARTFLQRSADAQVWTDGGACVRSAHLPHCRRPDSKCFSCLFGRVPAYSEDAHLTWRFGRRY